MLSKQGACRCARRDRGDGAYKGFKIKKQPEDKAVVVQRGRVSEFIRSLPPRLSDGKIEAIYGIACR